MAKSNVRSFEGTKKGEPFTVRTKLTDAEAMEALKGDGSFADDCAAQIELLTLSETMSGASAEAIKKAIRPNLIAWGFRLAEEKVNAVTLTLLPEFLPKFRKPIAFMVDGEAIHLSRCGDRSKHVGKIRVTNGEPYGDPNQRFYGMADPDGTWTPRRVTPSAIVNKLTGTKG